MNYHVSGVLVSFSRKLNAEAVAEYKLTHLVGFRDFTDLVVSMLNPVVLYYFLDFLSLCTCVQILCFFFYGPKEVDISIFMIFFSSSD